MNAKSTHSNQLTVFFLSSIPAVNDRRMQSIREKNEEVGQHQQLRTDKTCRYI